MAWIFSHFMSLSLDGCLRKSRRMAPILGHFWLIFQTLVFFLNKFILHFLSLLPSHFASNTMRFNLVLSFGRWLLETIGCWNFVVKIYFFLVEDEDGATCNNITRLIHEVASSIDSASELVTQSAIFAANYHQITHGIFLKLSKNIFNFKVWNFSHSFTR